jgi:predicted transglutaminase-like protease
LLHWLNSFPHTLPDPNIPSISGLPSLGFKNVTDCINYHYHSNKCIGQNSWSWNIRRRNSVSKHYQKHSWRRRKTWVEDLLRIQEDRTTTEDLQVEDQMKTQTLEEGEILEILEEGEISDPTP